MDRRHGQWTGPFTLAWAVTQLVVDQSTDQWMVLVSPGDQSEL